MVIPTLAPEPAKNRATVMTAFDLRTGHNEFHSR
jgi:hypothetical protein